MTPVNYLRSVFFVLWEHCSKSNSSHLQKLLVFMMASSKAVSFGVCVSGLARAPLCTLKLQKLPMSILVFTFTLNCDSVRYF